MTPPLFTFIPLKNQEQAEGKVYARRILNACPFCTFRKNDGVAYKKKMFKIKVRKQAILAFYEYANQIEDNSGNMRILAIPWISQNIDFAPKFFHIFSLDQTWRTKYSCRSQALYNRNEKKKNSEKLYLKWWQIPELLLKRNLNLMFHLHWLIKHTSENT